MKKRTAKKVESLVNRAQLAFDESGRTRQGALDAHEFISDAMDMIEETSGHDALCERVVRVFDAICEAI